MKKLTATLLCLCLLLSLAGCTGQNSAPAGSTPDPASSEPVKKVDLSPITSSGAFALIATHTVAVEVDLSPFALLGRYYMANSGYLFAKFPLSGQVFEPDTFRRYFFGTWESQDPTVFWNELILDDSEKCTARYLLTKENVWVSQNVLAISYINGGMPEVFWMDINKPDILYRTGELVPAPAFGVDDERLTDGFAASYIQQNERDPYYFTYTKTTDPVNEPQNNFVSNLRLREMAEQYGIDYSMLAYITYTNEKEQEFRHDDFFYSGIYLVSEEPDKLVFSTVLSLFYSAIETLNITYTVQKTNGVWERTIAVNK